METSPASIHDWIFLFPGSRSSSEKFLTGHPIQWNDGASEFSRGRAAPETEVVSGIWPLWASVTLGSHEPAPESSHSPRHMKRAEREVTLLGAAASMAHCTCLFTQP